MVAGILIGIIVVLVLFAIFTTIVIIGATIGAIKKKKKMETYCSGCPMIET